MEYLYRLRCGKYGYNWFNLGSNSRNKCPSICCASFTSREDLEIEISPIVVPYRSTPSPFFVDGNCVDGNWLPTVKQRIFTFRKPFRNLPCMSETENTPHPWTRLYLIFFLYCYLQYDWRSVYCIARNCTHAFDVTNHITVTSYERHGVSNHRQLNCLLTSL